ncbi:hypothetical protein IJ541_10615 [bacterium]|nr:hypothetical protein [bacterium]
MMNYLEIINKCLLELNYRQVNAFSELVKNDHKRIKTIVNVINKEICNIEGWNFLLRRTNLTLPANTTEILNTVNGRILYLFIDGQRYDFCDNVEPFVSGKAKACTYSSLAQNLLFPKFNEEKTVDIIYFTKNCVIDANSQEKTDMENADDTSLIPMPFAEQLLVYGTCLRLKANPQYFKFSYWLSMYKEALSNLKSKTSASVLNAPVVNIFRR